MTSSLHIHTFPYAYIHINFFLIKKKREKMVSQKLNTQGDSKEEGEEVDRNIRCQEVTAKFIQCPSHPSSQTPSIVHSQTKQVQLSQALLQHAGGHQQSDPPLEQPGSHADRVPRGHGPEGHGKRFGSQVPKLVSKEVQLSHH